MKQGTLVHFVAVVFQATASNGMRGETGAAICSAFPIPLRSSLRNALECLKSNRTAVPVHAVAIARRPPFGVSTAFFFCCPFDTYWGRLRRCSARLRRFFCAQQMARAPHQVCRRKMRFRTAGLHFQAPRCQAATCDGSETLVHETTISAISLVGPRKEAHRLLAVRKKRGAKSASVRASFFIN